MINDPINDPVKDLTNAERDLYMLILAGKNHNKQEYGKAIGKSTATVQRYLKHLTELGLIQREGSNKTGKWVIAK